MSETAKISTAPPRRRWPRILALTAGILVVLVVVLYFVATSSAFLQGVILPRVGKSMNASITVSDAAVHPFKEVVLHNLKVQTAGDEPLVVVPEFRARYNLMAILGGNLQIEEVAIASPVITLIENADGTSNLDPILKSSKEKSETKKPATSSSSSKPPQIDLKKFALTDATVRRVKLYAGGKRDVTEISHLGVTLEGLKNGQTGKLALSADLKSENNPPAPGTNGMLQASVKGNYDFALTADLKPGSVKGNMHLTVARAEGGMSDLASLGADLDCEMSPTEIKQVSLHFQKGQTRLGELKVSGPFDAAKGEGRLAVQVLSIDRQALNLFGAAQGMDFGPTTINSTNEIVLTKAGTVVSAVGQLMVNKMQITRAGETTPALNLQANYNATVDNEQHVMSIRSTTLGARLETDPPLEARLQLEVSVQNQVAEIRQVLLSLSPTARAKNQLELKGRVDMSKPDAIQGNLNLASESLDLTGYYDFATAKPKQPAAKPTASGRASQPPQAQKEPEPQKIPLRDFNFAVNLGRVYLREVDISNFQVGTKINGSHVVVAPFKLALNGAPVNSEVDLDLGVAGYKYNFTFGAQAMPLAPLVNSFQPERKGQISGTLNAKTYIAGAGVTPASLQKNLNGNFDIGTTNLNLAVANVQNPVLKALLNVIVMIPELARSPEAAISSLLGSWTGKVGGGAAKGGLSEDLSKSPIDVIVARGAISSGQLNIQNALVQSPAFQALATGSVTLADPMTNSAIQIPVSVSLPRALANSMHLLPPNTPADAAYVKLPDFLSMKGTAGQPKPDINKVALASLALQGVGGIPGVGDKAGGVLQGLGGLLKGNTSGTNAPAGAKTNSSPAGSLLDGLLKPKK